MDLNVEVERSGRAAVVRLAGDLDKLSAPRFGLLLRDMTEEGCTSFVVDTARLEFCDSSGLWVLVEHHRRVTRLGGSMTLTGVHGVLQRVLDVTGLKAVFDPVKAP